MNDSAPHPAPRTQVDPENPWPGLESYEESSREFFSGRGAETEEIARRVADEPVTVLFGKSGLGKTSLLKAGLFPRLRDRGFLPAYVRLQIRPDAPPLIDQLLKTLSDELRLEGVEHPAFAEGESIWEYLHRSGLEFWTATNRLVRPVFVLDQFEEVFTLGRSVPQDIQRFRHALADLAENRVPPAAAARLEQALPGDASLDIQAMPYKIIVSLREDFLADLEGWRAAMPSLRRNRMRLMPMGRDQALEAILNERTRHLVDSAHAEKIVAFLSSGAPGRGGADLVAASDGEPGPGAGSVTVEPALLSLFCRGVNEQRKRQRKARFDDALLEGGKETIVADFYRTTLADQPVAARTFIEEELVTEHGFRNSYSVDDALARGYLNAKALGALVDRRLLRRDYYLGTERVELTHDLLTRAVVGERDRRRESERLDRERRSRRQSYLVTGLSLGVALVCVALAAWAWNERRDAVGHRAVAEHQKAIAFEQRKIAEEERKRAEAQKTDAETQRSEAVKQEGIAVASAKAAEAASKAAALARNDANAQRRLAESREIAARAQTEMERDPGLAILLAREALRRGDTPDARAALLEASRFAWPVATIQGGAAPGSNPAAIALSPDGSRLAVAWKDGAVALWDLTGQKPAQVWKQASNRTSQAGTGNRTLAFSRDSARLASGTDRQIRVFDAASASGTELFAWDLQGPVGALTYSPDGGMLAITAKGHGVLLWVPGADPQAIKLQGGQKIPDSLAEARFGAHSGILTVATTEPLQVTQLIRQPDGEWKSEPADLSKCTIPESLSAGARGASASFPSFACLSRDRDKLVFSKVKTPDRLIRDIVWSGSGSAYVELLRGPELVVQRPMSRADSGEGMPSRIKGWQDPERGRNYISLISVSDDGRRLAAIEGRNGDIKVYTLGESKIFLTQMEPRHAAVAPDGQWIAVVSPAPRAQEGAPASSVTPTGLLVWLDDARGGGTREYTVPGPVTRLVATPGTLLVISAAGPKMRERVIGLDPKTGKSSWAHDIAIVRSERVELIGAEKGILRVEVPPDSAGGRSAQKFIKASDGQELLKAEPTHVVKMSEGRTAIVVCRARPGTTDRCDAEAYAVDGSRLPSRGTVQDLRATPGLDVSADGKYVLEPIDRRTALVWQTSAPRTGGPKKAVWSSPEHMVGAGSQLSDGPRMLDARHLWVVQTTGSEQRAAIYRLGQAGQDAVLVWSAQAKSGDGPGIDASKTRLLDDGRLLVTRRTGKSQRLEVYRLDSGRNAAPDVVYDEPVAFSPRGRHVVWRPDDKLAASSQLAVARLGSKEPLVQFPPAGNPPASFSPDDRWMALVPERQYVEFFNLAAGGRRFARFEGLETREWLDGGDVTFPGGERVAQIGLSNGAVVLVPLDSATVQRFARSLIDRELTREERCIYLPERGDCAATVRPSSAPVSDKKNEGARPKAEKGFEG